MCIDNPGGSGNGLLIRMNSRICSKAWVVLVATATLLGCSSQPNTGFPDSTGDDGGGAASSSGGGSGSSGSSSGTSSSSSSGAASGSSGGTTSGSSGSSGSSGVGSSGSSGSSSGGAEGGTAGINWGTTLAASDVGPVVTLTANPFQVAAGAEVYMCQVFANPFGGVDTDLVSMHGTMSAGSHHFFLFSMTALNAVVEPAVGTLGPCAGAGLEFHPFPFLSQQPNWTVNYPADANGKPMGYPLVGSNELMINVHYLNTGSTAIMANVSIDITPAKAGVVQTHVGSLFLNQGSMSVPATATVQSPYDSKGTWSGGGVPAAYSIFTSWSHMHRWGLKLSASTGSNTFYTETNWDSPNLYIHAPGMPEPSTATGPTLAVVMNGNPPIAWDCSYYNDTGSTLTFGDSALTNVMCIYIGQYYPASATAPDIIYNN
jgi:hypothetical protein